MGGGGSTSESKTRVFNRDQLNAIINSFRGLSQQAGQIQPLSLQQQGPSFQAQPFQVGEGLSQLSSGGLTSGEQAGIDQQLKAVEEGATGAQQKIQETARSQATSRGLFSSRGAIEQEAAQLANIPLFQAQQKAGIFGQQGQLQRQGLLSGEQARLGAAAFNAGQQQFGAQFGQQQAQFGAQQEQARRDALLKQLALSGQFLGRAGGLAGITEGTSGSESFRFGA